MQIPAALQEHWRRDPEWLARLPLLVAECAEAWGLTLEEPYETPRSLVIPAGEVVLKLNAPSHDEATNEAAALECWDGRGAAKVVARDDARGAFLLERCRPGTTLHDTDEDPVAVVMGLLPALWVTPGEPHDFLSIADEAQSWSEEIAHYYEAGEHPFDPMLLWLALDIFRTAPPDADELVNQDLHAWNILRAEREPWLVIDPKPAVGEREVGAVALLRNAAWDGGPTEVRRWLDALCELGLDRGRLQGWGVAHTLAWGWDPDGHWSPNQIEAAKAIFAA
jgi:streptomycin 6-kinase